MRVTIMRDIETFPWKQMYPYLSLDERKVAEFYHNIDRRSWLVWVKMTYFHCFFRTIPGVHANLIFNNSPILVAWDDIGLASGHREVGLQRLLVGDIGEHHQQQVEQYQDHLRWDNWFQRMHMGALRALGIRTVRIMMTIIPYLNIKAGSHVRDKTLLGRAELRGRDSHCTHSCEVCKRNLSSSV